MTEAMDRLCLLQFVLIQALLLTVCSSESDKNVTCMNITGTAGKPLTLTCNITCDPNCSCTKYKWIKNGTELKKDTDCDGKCTLNYTIQNLSMKDNETFTLWVQLKCGSIKGYLSVILSEEVTPEPPEEVTPVPPEQSVDNSPRNHQVVTIFVALLTILGLIGLAIFCRNHKTTVSQRLNIDLCRKQNTMQGMV